MEEASGICLFAGVKVGESAHFANASERSRATPSTRTFVAELMHQKCAAGTESVFVGGAFAATESPAARPTTASSVNALISTVISTEGCSVEVQASRRLKH